MTRPLHAAVALLLLAGLGLGCATRPAGPPPPSDLLRGAGPVDPAMAGRFEPRPLRTWTGDRWTGRGVSYGPHRDGQRPGGASPTRAELRQDLALLAGRFTLLRLYGADPPSADLLELIHEEDLPFKVLLGAWIAPESGTPSPGSPRAVLAGAREANRREVEAAVKLANDYPDHVLGLVVGNETQVDWSDHRVAPEVLIGWLREARRGAAVPVSTADDFAFWLKPESDAVAREVDFLVLHAYAMWNGKQLSEALPFTQEKYAAVSRRHPGLTVVFGEAGWATKKHTEGDQGKLIKGAPGEAEQHLFFDQFSAWVVEKRIPSTWFEAFDENWKGGDHPDEVEKHWGLWRADRTPKAAVVEKR
jgi:exo-beta-1,3-glucanase (GH17 family)